MNGREETTTKLNKRTKDILDRAPKYLTNYYNTLYNLTASTKYRYIKYIIEFMDYVELNHDLNPRSINYVKNVKPSMISEYIASMDGLSGSIKAARMYGVKKFFEYCVMDEIIEKNPFDKISMPKDTEEHKITALTPKEINVIIDNIEKGCGVNKMGSYTYHMILRNKAIFVLAVFLGLRVRSITEINIEDLNMEDNLITVREKGGKTRTLGFNDCLKNDLENWIEARAQLLSLNDMPEDTKPFFLTRNMTRISTTLITNMIKDVTFNINKHISPHKLRSTCATIILKETGDITAAAYVLGHSDLRNTQRYAKVSNEAKNKAMNAVSKALYGNKQ